MDKSVKDLQRFFASARKKANAKIKPFVIEMEKISVKRAKNLITDAQANVKMRNCCIKNGISPTVVDNSFFEANSIKMSGVGMTPINFNPTKKGHQKLPDLKINFNPTKKKATPKANLPDYGFKPVNLFKQAKQPKANVKMPKLNIPNFNVKMPRPKHKKHQGRFGMVDLMPGPKGSNDLMIKPIFPSKKQKKKKGGIKIKPFKIKGLF